MTAKDRCSASPVKEVNVPFLARRRRWQRELGMGKVMDRLSRTKSRTSDKILAAPMLRTLIAECF
jgi:hypothetical protein